MNRQPDSGRNESRADQIIREGDPAAILGMAMRARSAAERGEWCECAAPEIAGLDLMCGDCLREVKSQREKRERMIREPHGFVPRGESGLKARQCKICAFWEDDPRHV